MMSNCFHRMCCPATVGCQAPPSRVHEDAPPWAADPRHRGFTMRVGGEAQVKGASEGLPSRFALGPHSGALAVYVM